MALSGRQVERLFRKVYGLSPQSLVRVNRFQAVLAHKNRLHGVSWSDLSHIHGYFDQSHLCRDFREFTGMAPQEFYTHHLG